MFVRFWGVRGSTPTPTKDNLGYGGNTPCVELRSDAGHLFILDCGTGLRMLGKALTKEMAKKPIKARIFLTHYHWDHIQGIPFFMPLYSPGNQFVFHSYHFQDESLQQALETQMTDPYFPVDMSFMAAHRHFYEISEEKLLLDDLEFQTKRLHHPQGCLGYRIKCNGRVLVYATDNEPGQPMNDRNLRELADGADVMIYDAQYLPSEMDAHRNWGHSNWKEGVAIAKECKVKRLVLFHHDPDRDDKAVDKILKLAKDNFDHVQAASEGLVVKI